MSDYKGNDAFYEWEQSKYGDNSPLTDDDRILWVEGYKEGVLALFNHAVKQGGV
jgi:hypothetical protein